MKELFNGAYNNKRVFLTGHTGFKGSWLLFWLNKLGAHVCGYSLEPVTKPNHISLLNIDSVSYTGDIRDRKKLNHAVKEFKPDIVFHLAAQALVRYSYREPVETFETNVMGTVNVFESCRGAGSVNAIVNVTSDKCYENREWVWGYRENDPMGGHDPYSASKGCSELVASAYRNSFFNPDEFGKSHEIALASARAGNVIGGGDWAEDRLVPDIMKAAAEGKDVVIRNPHATRPWQHVLEPLSGYLLLGQKLLERKKEFSGAWNFGPGDEGATTVGEIVEKIKMSWRKINYYIQSDGKEPHEANWLKLDCSKARALLNWNSIWDINTAIEKTTNWYKNYYERKKIITDNNINDYVRDAKIKQAVWAV